MTDRLGSGDYYLPSPAGQGAEARFRLRERFTDVLEEEVTQACDDLRHAVQTAIETLSTVRKDQDAVEQLLRQRGLTREAQPRYGEAFGVWPPPTFPRDANDLRLDDIERLEHRWALDSWLLRILAEATLDSWSEDWQLTENPWVASHLLARIYRASLLGSEERALPVFGSAGVLAWFTDSLDESFRTFRSWDPTQEKWREWKKAALAEFHIAVSAHKEQVETEAMRRGLARTPKKRKIDRDLRRLVRFQLLSVPQVKLRAEGEYDTKAVQKAIRRTADLVGLKLRTAPNGPGPKA